MKLCLKLQLAALFLAASLHAGAVSLTTDFSLTNGNPNGQWTYSDNTTDLSFQTPLNNGNAGYPALSNGFWGLGNNLNTSTPTLFEAQVNGSSAGESNLDFLAGDIVGHSPNDGTTLFETWTAPSAGTITNLSLLIWYAHSAATPGRSNQYELLDNSSILTSGTVSSTANFNRNNPGSYNNAGGFSVAAGDLIELGTAKTAGQAFGSLTGESLNFTFTPSTSGAPEPGTIAMLAMGLAGIALAARSRRRT